MLSLQQHSRSGAPGKQRAVAVGVPRASVSRAAAVRVRAATQADTQAAAGQVHALKQDIIKLSGKKYGHDIDEATRQQVQAKVKQLEELQLPVKVELDALTGTKWTTVFTTSTGTSSGKVGPFITDLVQEFPADQPGTYFNVSTLGLVSARLRGDFQVSRPDRVDLEFRDLKLRVGPFQAAEKVFDAGQMRGYWRVSYADKDCRVFYTNMGNLFVLRKLDD